MQNHYATGRAYKATTLQQLRSFCETARLGSFTAAAASLGLAHPTVWKQVHALEREFDLQLVKPFGRGCQLTEAGRILAEMATPAVNGISALKRRLQEALAPESRRLLICATPRVLVEDLPPAIGRFRSQLPDESMTLREMANVHIPHAVESGEADLGIVMESSSHSDNSWLIFEPAYELEIVLITPKKHPLASRKQVRPRDLRAYPLVNGPNCFKDMAINAALHQLGFFRGQSCLIEAFFAATIRQYVALGFGIGLVPRLVQAQCRDDRFHERNMSAYFGRQTVYLIWRTGGERSAAATAFAEILKRPIGADR